MSCMDTLLTWLLYSAVLCGTFYAFRYQFWVGVILTVPALLGDVIVQRAHRRAAFAVKLLLLFQTVMMWSILPWATFHGFDTAQMSPHVVNIIKQTQDSIPISREMITGTINNWIPKLGMLPAYFSSEKTEVLVEEIFGNLSTTNFPDLKYRTPQEVRQQLPMIFNSLPRDFDPSFRNPCWYHEGGAEYLKTNRKGRAGTRGAVLSHQHTDGKILSCLPYVYLLGQPKSGTSDLFERLTSHPDVIGPDKKEVRWFTRGEFTTARIQESQRLGKYTSIFSFTSSFDEAAHEIAHRHDGGIRSQVITVDGGPHTLWWPTQSPDGELLPDDIPAPQIIREMQPNAKFLITLSDPVNRMYSDYYFLDDSLKVVESMLHRRGDSPRPKSPEEFHIRAVKQVTEFKECVISVQEENHDIGWFRASQYCAHDRKKFGVGGWGRLNIGLYVAFIEKWLEHFSLNQFHIVRLEDYHSDPMGYMKGVFQFLDLDVNMDKQVWDKILSAKVFNQHKSARPNMLPETDALLRNFYQPYNDLLAKLMKSDAFRWLPEYKPDYIHGNYDALDPHSYRDRDALQERITHMMDKSSHKVVQPGVRGGNLDARSRPDAAGSGDLDFLIWRNGGNFSLDGLSFPEPNAIINKMARQYVDPGRRPRGGDDAGEQLCIAAFAMDLLAIKTLLLDHRVHGNTLIKAEYNRNAFHCLSALNLNVDGHTKSHIFHLLKGEAGYLTDIFDPPLPLQMDSTIALEIIKSMEPTMLKIANWLLRAGAEVDLPDSNGVTPLMFASLAGDEALIKFLIDNGANVNSRTRKDERTAAHYAAAFGHIKVLKLLKEHGADFDLPDFAQVTARQIIESPGPIFAEDAKEILDIQQEAVRQINRPLHPFYHKSIGNDDSLAPKKLGGFDTTRLKDYEHAIHCDADQYDAGEISGQEIYERYLARSRPILIRGLIDKWPALERYQRDKLYEDHGKLQVTVTSIPYADKFHGEGTTEMSLKTYMDQVENHTIAGGTHPWYVFIGHPLKQKPRGLRGSVERDIRESEDPMGRSAGVMIHTHLVEYDAVPTPLEIHRAQELVTMGPSAQTMSDPRDRKGFINAQWAYGGPGTGAPVHYHNTAWNALVYGSKYWVMYPPHTMVMSNKQILQFIEDDLPAFESRGHKAMTCVQTAGDVMIIPESWSHGVLNIQESVAVATEFENFHWRFKPGSRLIMEAIPADATSHTRPHSRYH